MGRDISCSRDQIAQQIKMLPEGTAAPSPLNTHKTQDSHHWFQSKIWISVTGAQIEDCPFG